MKIETIRRVFRFAGLIVPLTWIPGSAAAQARAQSYGLAVSTATLNQTTPSAVSPTEGGMAQNQSGSVSIAGFVTAEDAFAVASGEPDGVYSDAVSSATLGRVSILNGLITADGVVAMASTAGGTSSADGSSLANLVVNGVEVSDPAPNTRVDLPGVGYAVLNEQIATASGITVNMIRVVLQQSTLLGGLETTGSIIVGSATSSVN